MPKKDPYTPLCFTLTSISVDSKLGLLLDQSSVEQLSQLLGNHGTIVLHYKPRLTHAVMSMATTKQITGMALAEEMEARRPRSAWAMSLVTHAVLVVLLGLSWRMVPKGAAIDPDRAVGIVLVHEQQGKREYFDPNADDTANDQAAASAMSQAMPNVSEVPVDLSEALPGAQELTAGGMAESILDATQLTGDGSRRRGGMDQGTSTEVFGLTGVGTKFVYVFDRSGSMSDYRGRPLQAAKMELGRSLDDLNSIHQFQIIFYNENPKIFQPRGQAELIWADEQGKASAREFIQTIDANGGTQHVDALKLALGMRPDVVFFLTDADQPKLTYDELQRIRAWNKGTTIHAIEFGAGPRIGGENFLMKLARQNGGQHAYVDVRRLRGNP